MSTWLKSRLRDAEGFLKAVDEVASQYVTRANNERTNGHLSKNDASSESTPVRERAEQDVTVPAVEANNETRWIELCESLRSRLAEIQKEKDVLRNRLRETEHDRKQQLNEMESLMKDLRQADTERQHMEATLQAQIVAQQMELTKAQSETRSWEMKAKEIESQFFAVDEKRRQETTDRAEEQTYVIDGMRKEITEMESALRREKEAHLYAVTSAEERVEQLQQELTSTAERLVNQQRKLDQNAATIAKLEDELKTLRVEIDGDRTKFGGVDSLREATQDNRILYEELEKESQQRSQLERDLAALRVEIAAAKQQRPDLDDLHSQLTDVQVLLRVKETELEKATNYTASIETFHERQRRRLQDQIDQLTAQRKRSDTVVSIDPSSKPTPHLTSTTQNSLSLFDQITTAVVSLMRRSSIARIAVCLYLLVLHLYLYVLLTRIQALAVRSSNNSDV